MIKIGAKARFFSTIVLLAILCVGLAYLGDHGDDVVPGHPTATPFLIFACTIGLTIGVASFGVRNWLAKSPKNPIIWGLVMTIVGLFVCVVGGLIFLNITLPHR
jgi:hypothetical protein